MLGRRAGADEHQGKNVDPARTVGVNVAALTVSRCGSSVTKMIYAGSLPFLLVEWEMSGAEAGLIQSLFNLSYAISLLLSSWLADHLGAKRIFNVSVWLCAAAFLLVALFATNHASALFLFPLLGITLGGSYTPSLMLVSASVSSERRGAAIGWVLAGSSLGYFAAIAMMASLVPVYGLQASWIIAATAPVLGACFGAWAVARAPHSGTLGKAKSTATSGGFMGALRSRESVLLTTGYTAHCWELLGMWAWAPAFITFSLSQTTDLPPLAIGVIAAAAIHLSGTASTLISGVASDRWGRRSILLIMGAAGAALSLTFGWSGEFGPVWLIAFAALYGFTTIGDSGVLSTAMTESVPAQYLGSMLALRSILGFGAGAISPLAFGLVYDLTSASDGEPAWGLAFSVFAVGGLLATASAVFLRSGRKTPPQRPTEGKA
jgi:MFS family permease